MKAASRCFQISFTPSVIDCLSLGTCQAPQALRASRRARRTISLAGSTDCMKRLLLGSLGAALGLGLLLTTPENAAAQRKAPPGDGYKKVSTLVQLPDFLPGLGTLYADPTTLPAGPFLAYDRHGQAGELDLHDPAQGHERSEGICRSQDRARGAGGSRRRGVQRRASGRGRAALPHCPVVHLRCQGSGTQIGLR